MAVDAMQETFIKLLRSKERLDGRAPSSLLFTTATNTCLNIIRGVKRRKESAWGEHLELFRDPRDREQQFLSGHFLDRLFQEEADTTRTIAWLHYVDGFTLEETAEQVGMSVSGIRKRLRNLQKRGLARMEE